LQATVGHRRADTQVLLAAVAAEEQLETGQQKHEGGDLALAGEAPQALGQRCRHLGETGAGAVVEAGRTRQIGGQIETVVTVLQAVLPVLQLLAIDLLARLAVLPQGIVEVLHRQRRQLDAASLQGGAIAGGQLVQQHLQRPAVGGAVVQAEQQEGLVGTGRTYQAHPQRMLMRQVERAPGLGLGNLALVLGPLGRVAGMLFHRQITDCP